MVGRVVQGTGVALALLLLGAMLALWLVRPAQPDAFYAAPPDLPARPGALLRAEPFHRGVPEGARAWRILHTTTTVGGAPAVASAIVMLADGVHAGNGQAGDGHAGTPVDAAQPRPVLAWTHGTTGVDPGCAPSLLRDPFANVPAVPELLAEGWVYVATDYVGQGTGGTHPYLIGDGQARSALDAVRAARELSEARVGTRVAVWGHSQGGHAALWTGMLAPAYAPELEIVGVAAAAPASDLPSLMREVQYSAIGRVMTSFVLHAYARTYADVRVEDYARGVRARIARGLAGRCLDGTQALVSVAVALPVRGSLFHRDPLAGALGARLTENTPRAPLAAPLLLTQGADDPLILPAVQAAWVAERCAAGQSLEYVLLAGRDHLSLVAPGSPLVGDWIEWTRARFAGARAAEGCTRRGAQPSSMRAPAADQPPSAGSTAPET